MKKLKDFLKIFHTTFFRLIAFYIVFLCVIAFFLVGYMEKLSIDYLTRKTETALLEEGQNLQEAYNSGGLEKLKGNIERCMRGPRAKVYLLCSPEEKPILGNILNVTTDIFKIPPLKYKYFTYSRHDGGLSEAVGVVVVLPNFMHLLVGYDLGEYNHYKHVIKNASLIAMGTTLFVSIFVWGILSYKTLRRLTNISQTTQKLIAGDLSGRLPVTKLKDEFDELSLQLNIMLSRVEDMAENMRYVSDNIAHDLKTPLTRMRSYIENVLTEDDPELYKAALEKVVVQTDDLIKTFNALLLISRIETKAEAAMLEKTNIREIVEDTAELYELHALEKNIKLTLGEVFDCELKINRQLVAQALFNLTDNAIKYGSSTGDKEATIHLSMEKDKHNLLIHVIDNGPGIAERDKDRVMQRFVRLEKSRTFSLLLSSCLSFSASGCECFLGV